MTTPSPDEFALLAYANSARADQRLSPFVWSDALGQAARAHSDDETAHGCYQHDSCNGQAWYKRVGSYYPGWYALGENISSGGATPRAMHDAWMASAGHRANILGGYIEFGAGISPLAMADGSQWLYSTEDFGSRTAVDIPVLPAGGVVPRLGFGGDSREILVNFFDDTGSAPKTVRALIGSACVNLSKVAGTASNGTYGTNRTFPSDGCTPVVFEAITAGGTRYRWPENKAILVGTGYVSLNCALWTTAVPTQDCGGGGLPPATPTPGAPSPTPTPDGSASSLKTLRVVLKPGKANASKGTVNVQASLLGGDAFDPTDAPVALHISAGQTFDWQANIPAVCGDAPCLTPNSRLTVFKANLGTVKISFVAGKSGKWKLRLSATGQSLGSLDPGLVRVTLSVDGRTFTGSADGELKESGLFAN